jgi:riboflavin biosynthesis pyrimidine reductase
MARRPTEPKAADALERLVEGARGRPLPLPPELAERYGPLAMPTHRGRPHVIANFATTLDGVASLRPSGRSGGGEITGFDPHDRMVMGLLRAAADAVIVGAGTLRAVPRHRWTAERVYPPLADAFRALRHRLGQPPVPLNVVVSARGRLDLRLPLFASGDVPVLVVTTRTGARRLMGRPRSPSVEVVAAGEGPRLSADSVLRAVDRSRPGRLILVEGGPHLLGAFLSEGRLDELFLTVTPQVAGRDRAHRRLALVEGAAFAPSRPLWGEITDVRRGGRLLMLRIALRPPAARR